MRPATHHQLDGACALEPLSPRKAISGPRDAGFTWAFTIAGLAFAAVVATNLLSLGVDNLRTSLVNANWEFSWSHDADTLVLAVGIYAASRGARRAGARRRLWAITAAIMTLFFLDEVSPLHTQIGSVTFGKLLYTPILAALVVCLGRLAAAGVERRVLGWGLLTLFGAFAMHVVGLHLLRPLGYTNWIYQSGVGVKEGAELAGLFLVVPALWRLAVGTR